MKNYWREAACHLRETGLTGDWESLETRYEPPGFETLCRIMAFQQVSGAHALRVVERIEHHFGGHLPSPSDFTSGNAADIVIRCGVAPFRAERMHNLALLVEHNGLTLPVQDSDRAADDLTELEGIGCWTASMYRMFALRSRDIWPNTDLGVLKGLALYKRMNLEDVKKAPGECREWSPYRTLATWFLWQLVPGFPLPGFRRPDHAARPSHVQDSLPRLLGR